MKLFIMINRNLRARLSSADLKQAFHEIGLTLIWCLTVKKCFIKYSATVRSTPRFCLFSIPRPFV